MWDGKPAVPSPCPLIQEAGAGWIRINFRLDCFQDWEDAACVEGGESAKATYDGIVNEARALSLNVLGLLSNES